MINFLAEISGPSDTAILPTPSSAYPKNFNIYELDIRIAEGPSWWTEWGGWRDNFQGSNIEIYYGGHFLRPVGKSELLNNANEYTMAIEGGIVYINVPRHTWLYPDYQTEGRTVIPVLSSPLDVGNPSFNLINNTPALFRLAPPSVGVRLSEGYNGINLQQQFSISLINSDGLFDDCDSWNLFNTPAHLKKATKENPAYADFKNIRDGMVENVATSFSSLDITVSDRFRAMNESACRAATEDAFPGIGITEDSAMGKNMPIVYGAKTINLLKLNGHQYFTADGARGVSAVYDRDGYIIPPSTYGFNIANGVITMDEYAPRPSMATVIGKANNKIGEIIVDFAINQANIPWGPTNWNVGEVSDYIENLSPRISIEIRRGNVKRAIGDVLASDMSFFIQQPDGRFTIRRYGQEYATHAIDSKMLTKKPEKDYGKATENYFSSCVINYGFTGKGDYKSFLFYGRETEAEDRYRKIVRRTFDTNLTDEEDARGMAGLLSDRYTALRQTVKIGLGIDTSHMNLLDTVIMDFDVNGRKFSGASKFIIKEIDVAQDIITLEEI